MRAFHGTRNTAAVTRGLMGSLTGSLGSGIYLTRDAAQAQAYGHIVLECEIQLLRPWKVDLDYESELAETLEFDSPGLQAIDSLPGGRELNEGARLSEDGMFDGRLTDKLLALGYDGIEGTYPDGSCEIVAFAPTQVTLLGHAEVALETV